MRGYGRKKHERFGPLAPVRMPVVRGGSARSKLALLSLALSISTLQL